MTVESGPIANLVTSAPSSLPLRSAEVCAVLVTYHPDGDFDARCKRIASQVGHVVVVDNGSSAHAVAMLRTLTHELSAALIEHAENLGIASALNAGVRHARLAGASWALLFDQDSQVDRGLVEALLAVAYAVPDRDRVAIVGSRFRDTRGRPDGTKRLAAADRAERSPGVPTGAATKNESTDPPWHEVESVITSGSLLSIAAYESIGPFREEFFIDYVDTEFCRRARARGFQIVQSRASLMSHTIGAATQHRWFGRLKWTTHHTADRRYYIARNDTVMLKEYGTSRGNSWLLKSLARSWRLTKRIALYEEDKGRKIHAVWQGWWHGVNGRMGKRP